MPIRGASRPHEGPPVLDRARTLWRARHCPALGLAPCHWGCHLGLPFLAPRKVLTRPPAGHDALWVGCPLQSCTHGACPAVVSAPGHGAPT